jgi:hypothetical protein
MKISLFFAIALTFITAIWLLGGFSKRSYFENIPRPNDSGVCSSHCTSGKDSNGGPMDVYDCCECMATVTNHYEPNFHKCMCSYGYGDYCFLPVTNMLLSQ